MTSDLAGELKKDLNSILGLRDAIGVALKDVFIVTRTWSGLELGDGDASEIKASVLPSPRVVEYKHDLRIREGGAVQQGDILIKSMSKQSYPTKDLVDCTVSRKNVEKFYEVGGKLYRPVGVTEKLLTWVILLRPLSDQARY